MTPDNRRVQTAVLGSPDSDHPLSLPTDRKEAEWYLSRYRGKVFYCGVWLGGCGWRLTGKLYGDRVCHFAHLPDPKGLAPDCERRGGIDSADHLFIHRGLASCIGEQQRFDGRMDKERCTDLLVRRRQSRSAIKVQFVNLTPAEWEERDEVLRAQFGHVDWIVGPTATRTGRYLLERDGYALRVRCEEGMNGTRAVTIGTETSDGDLEWNSLHDCEITDKGLVTPLLRKVRARGQLLTGKRTAVLPGFPLAVKDIVIRPQEATTRPVSGAKIPPNSHVAAINVIIGESEPINARLIVSGRLDLVIGEPYSLVEPASVDVVSREGQLAPAWTIFSTGLTPISPIGVPERNSAQTSKLAPSSFEETSGVEPKQAGGTRGSDELIRHRLTTLIAELRKARKAGDRHMVLALLKANRILLNELNRREFRNERTKVIEIDRWAHAKMQTQESNEDPARQQIVPTRQEVMTAKTGTPKEEPVRASMDPVRHELALLLAQLRGAGGKRNYQRISELLEDNAELMASEAAVRPDLQKLIKDVETFRRLCRQGPEASVQSAWKIMRACSSLNKRINRAKSTGNMPMVRNAVEELRAVIQDGRSQGRDLGYEERLLAEHDRWLSRFLTQELASSPALDAPVSPTATSASMGEARLQEIIDQLQEAERADRIDGAQALLKEGMRLVMRLGEAIDPEQRQNLVDSGQWLAEVTERARGQM
ncbi:hypothetical protein ACFFMN_35195 [Planobispora siamensis]|uniref:Uncharacterized protein n=1 Tax=Planobispora siamensis TaxID=936338 RepID=A0A8J3WNY4_9ACTN|nr:hypothetical protein [Planobispora siamensis]GIH96543.1 hypothetical protein Psi01_71730 [Planobispora siamensis]